MHPYIIVAIVLTLLVLVILLSRNKDDKQPPLVIPPLPPGAIPTSDERATTNVLAVYGDSISVPLDLRALTQNYINRAVAGTTLTQWFTSGIEVPGLGLALKPMAAELAECPASAVLLRYGINDANFNAGLTVFRAAVEQFVDECRSLGKVPILSSLTRFSGTNAQALQRLSYSHTILAVAQEKKTHFIDVDGVQFNPGDTPDNLHPGPAYHQRIQDFIIDDIREKKILPQ